MGDEAAHLVLLGKRISFHYAWVSRVAVTPTGALWGGFHSLSLTIARLLTYFHCEEPGMH